MTNSIGNYTQDPNSTLDYRVDWTSWLDGDTIYTGAFSATPALPNVIQSSTTSSTVGTVWLSGLILGVTYVINHQIITTLGRTDERSFIVTAVDQ